MKTIVRNAIARAKQLKTSLCIAAAGPVLLVGCTAVVDPTPVTTTHASYGAARTHVFVARRPPAARIERRPRAPGSRYVWVSGHWRWSGTDYDWVPGRWVVRPRRRAMWVDGTWSRRNGGWAWYEGYWR